MTESYTSNIVKLYPRVYQQISKKHLVTITEESEYFDKTNIVDIKNDSLDLALNLLNIDYEKYYKMNKKELERKYNMSDGLIHSAYKILLYYK
jgi:hypothetical protein